MTHVCVNSTGHKAGEDGLVKIWSKAAMLRSTLAQTGPAFYVFQKYFKTLFSLDSIPHSSVFLGD